ncbi:unnamed protein product [Polarella glacialis]|uniref:Uncharacterized protein n=1 Tax=Polarella glacialis TaxID=89957 RepID=A0A813DLQ8_POLGL|nr:unnamed protein product [Polarella glacialis]CAE8739596.1 unnamed protein product [Polarella glacialis]
MFRWAAELPPPPLEPEPVAAEPQADGAVAWPLCLELVERHSRHGQRLAVVAGATSEGEAVEVVFHVCEGRVSAADFAALGEALPRGRALSSGDQDFLECRVCACEPQPSRSGARVYQASAFVAVRARPRSGLVSAEIGPQAAKADRHDIFSAWLVEEFAGTLRAAFGYHHEADRSQQNSRTSYVLEVAGGSGRLAAALARRGVCVTVVDPRPCVHSVDAPGASLG